MGILFFGTLFREVTLIYDSVTPNRETKEVTIFISNNGLFTIFITSFTYDFLTSIELTKDMPQFAPIGPACYCVTDMIAPVSKHVQVILFYVLDVLIYHFNISFVRYTVKNENLRNA